MQHKIAIIGLGYVGLPLAHAFSDKYKVVGFDINQDRIEELNGGFDRTLDNANEPDLTPLIKSSEAVGGVLKKDDIVIYESTVYPGVTFKENCLLIPIDMMPLLSLLVTINLKRLHKNNMWAYLMVHQY